MLKRLLLLLLSGLFYCYCFGQTAEDFFDQGIKKFKLQDYSGALVEFNKSVELNPQYSKAYNNRGIVKSVLNDILGSVEDFNTAIALDPMNISAYRNLGLSKLKLRNYDGAIGAFNKVLQFNPNDEVALKNLALLNKLFEISSSKVANNEIESKPQDIKTVDSSKTDVVKTTQLIDEEYKVSVPVKSEFQYGTTFLKNLPETLAVLSVNEGRLKAQSLDYIGAFEDYSKSIELDSENAQAYYCRGILKVSLRNYKGDLKSNRPAANNSEKYEYIYVKSQLLTGDYGAIEDFTKAIEYNPQFAEAYYNRALCLYNLKQFKNAVVDFSKAIEFNSDLTDAYYYRGISKGVLNDMSGACLDFMKASQLGNSEAKDLIKECQ